MNSYEKACLDYFDAKGIDYDFTEDEGVIIASLSEANLRIVMAFDDCNVKFVNVLLSNIAPGDANTFAALMMCNKANLKYKTVKFVYVVEARDIHMICDAIVDMGTVGEECVEIILRIAAIFADTYPSFRKLL